MDKLVSTEIQKSTSEWEASPPGHTVVTDMLKSLCTPMESPDGAPSNTPCKKAGYSELSFGTATNLSRGHREYKIYPHYLQLPDPTKKHEET